jgi:hypothetical protein
MPRNQRKTRCRKPGCRSWAMRGRALCRSHLDHELGPRGAGAPRRNLNALKTAAHARPLAAADLHTLAKALVRLPDQLPELVAAALQSIHARTGDPYKTLVAFQSSLTRLLLLVDVHLFAAEIEAVGSRLPPSERGAFLAAVRARASAAATHAGLASLRQQVLEPQKSSKTSTGTPVSTPSAGQET